MIDPVANEAAFLSGARPRKPSTRRMMNSNARPIRYSVLSGRMLVQDNRDQSGWCGDLPSPKSKRNQRPGTNHSDTVNCVLAQGKVVCLILRQTCLLKEIGRVVGEGVSAEILDRPAHAYNFSAAQINSLEAIPKGRAFRDLPAS